MGAFDFLGTIWDSVKENPEIAGGILGAAMGSIDGEDQSVTQRPFLYDGQEQGIVDVLNLAKQEYNQGPQQYYPGQQVASLDPNTIAGQNAQLGTIGQQQQMADLSAYGAADLLGGGAGRIDGFNLPGQVGFGIDQGLQNAVMNPIMDRLKNDVLPGLDLQATQQGAFGGTRQAQQKGRAASSAIEDAADAVARANLQARQQSIGQRNNDIQAMLSGRGQDINQNQIYNQAVGQGIRAVPGAMASLLIPGQIQTDIGAARAQYDQQLIDADKARFDFNQQAPYSALDRLQSRMTLAAPQGNIETTQGQQANLGTALGGALSGAQLLGSMFAGSNSGNTTYTPGGGYDGSNIDSALDNWMNF